MYANRRSLVMLTAVLICVLLPLRMDAAIDMFLDMGNDIRGECTDPEHIDEIDVLAWSWGLSQPGTFHDGGSGTAGKVSIQDLSFTKYVDSATPPLMETLSKGTHIPQVALSLRKTVAGHPIEFYTITLDKVIVSSLSLGGASADYRLTENVTLNFAEVTVTYLQVWPGGGTGNTGTYFWDVPANVGGGGDSTSVPPDNDGDGMPDSYENANDLDNDTDDTDKDKDGDHLTNLQEFLIGTRANDPDSVLKCSYSYTNGQTTASLEWPCVSNKQYRVLCAASLTNTFASVQTITAQTTGTARASVVVAPPAKFYRVSVIVP